MIRNGGGPYIAYARDAAATSNEAMLLQVPSGSRDIRTISLAQLEQPLEIYVQDMDLQSPSHASTSFDRADANPQIFGSPELTGTSQSASLVASFDRDSFSELDISVRKQNNQMIYRVHPSSVAIVSSNREIHTWILDLRAATFSLAVVEHKSANSWTRFLVHFLQFVSVSFGWSIYTLMVFPSNMYVR
jgi:hypothetical protein